MKQTVERASTVVQVLAQKPDMFVARIRIQAL